MRKLVVAVTAVVWGACCQRGATDSAAADVHQRQGDITVDGRLDESAWAAATPLVFSSYDGKPTPVLATGARMLWDAEALWLAFEVTDPDPFTPYSTRDAPLYESEALEIFIDADGDKDVYVELQSAFSNVHFDAAFAGGQRKGMETAYNVDFTTASTATATGYVQEWRIPVGALRDVPGGAIAVGDRWHINLFRLERIRDAARTRVIKTEASAWSPPRVGDFHTLARFGVVHFVR